METTKTELKQVLGAIIFAARQPMTAAAVRKVLQETAEINSEDAGVYGGVKEAEIKACLHQTKEECEAALLGVHLIESSEGFRFQSDPAGGPWVRHMLNVGKPTRLSRPALETLAIIAYRQPISRAELEGVRGVAVDHVIRMLMEMQLIKIVGRSELPGRPMLYGTTALFLEHFGLKDLKELPGISELARMDAMRKKQEQSIAASQEAAPETTQETPVDTDASSESSDKSDESDTSDESEEDDDEDEFDDEDDDEDDDDKEKEKS